MKTKEEILSSYEPVMSYPRLYLIDDVIEAMETYALQFREDKWVSVEDVPRKADMYLGLLDNGKHHIVEVYMGLEGFQFNPHYNITHWQPLPAPPKINQPLT